MKAFLGALEFQENEYEELKELYESLKTKQKPHTLFISCVDSRVVPNLITGTKPGELYETTKAKTPYIADWIQFLEPIKEELKKPSAIQQPFRQAFMAYRAFERVLATQQSLKL